MIIVLMGVTGSGKTTIGELLADHLKIIFADGDDFHPPANKAKMAAGHPLDDNDRAAWLEALNHILQGWFHDGKGGILACSALKEKYRDTLQQGMPPHAVVFCHLDASKELLTERLAARHHEYMNPNLLDSQLATLEAPSNDEAIHVNNDLSPEEVVTEIIHLLPKAPKP